LVASRLQALTEHVIEEIEAAGYQVESLDQASWNNDLLLMTEA